MPSPPTSARYAARLWVLRVLGLAVGAVAGGAVGFALATAPDVTEPVEAPLAKFSQPTHTEALVQRFGCWTDAAPPDVEYPGGVVVVMPGADATSHEGPRVVGMALEQVFDGADHGLRVVAFCRR